MEPRHELQVEALKLFFEANDIEILQELKREESYTFATDAQGFTHVQLRHLNNYGRIGIFLWVKDGRYSMAVNLHFI